MKLLLVCAGSADVASGTVLGQSDPRLDVHGFTRIQSLAAGWSGKLPRFLFASDLRRAAQSAQIFAAHLALEPLFDPRLREIDCGRWNGRRMQDLPTVERAHLATWRARAADQAAPGGESLADVIGRTSAWLAALVHGTTSADIVLAVAHPGSIGALLCHVLAMAPEHIARLRLDDARVSAIRRDAGGFAVSCVNALRFEDALDED